MFNQDRIFRLFQLIHFLRCKPAKSLRNLASLLGISERTVYRYLELLEEIGFPVIRDGANRVMIPDQSDKVRLPFTHQEVEYLNFLIRGPGKDNMLADSVLLKIGSFAVPAEGAEHYYKARLSRIIEDLSLAIAERKQVVLKNYYSAHSQEIRNRTVEPVCFTENYETLSAYEIEKSDNKYFNLERISEVEILDQPMRFQEFHAFILPDIFGFQGKDMEKEVELTLSMRASLLLMEEYPMSRAWVKPMPGSDRFSFKAKVQSFLAPGRFVLGLLDEVEVLGSREFKSYLRQLVKNRLKF